MMAINIVPGSNRCGNLHGCKAREHANGGNDPLPSVIVFRI